MIRVPFVSEREEGKYVSAAATRLRWRRGLLGRGFILAAYPGRRQRR
jgi:hypothetical protein